MGSTKSTQPLNTQEHIDYKTLADIKKFAPIDVLGNAAGIILVHVIFQKLMHSETIPYWTMLVSVLLALRMAYYYLLNHHMHILPTKQWVFVSILLPLMAGIAWGSLAFFTPDNDIYILAMICIFFAIMGGALGATGHQFPVFAAFAIPLSLLLSAHLVLSGNALFLALAISNITFLALSLYMSYKFTKITQKERLLQVKNEELMEHLKNEKNAAEKANTDKSRFLAAASHDLRQPIHALNLFIEALNEQLTQDKQRQLLNKIRLSAQAMGSLLTSLLDISRLEAGLVQVQLKAFYLQPLLAQLEEEFAPQAKQKGLQFTIATTIKTNSSQKMDIHHIVVQSDIVLLENVLRNLIANALKYTKKGQVSIFCATSDNDITLYIQDTGIGIAPQDQERVFDEFYQVDNPERDRSKGIGLGLSIVKKLCELLGHNLEMTSQVGKGTTFAIQLASASQPDKPTNIQQIANINMPSLVLVVDDEALILEAMRALLEPWGCTVLTCQTPEEARQHAIAHPEIDLLLVDYRLRDHRKGSEVVHEVRELLNTKLPAIIISGDTDPQRMQEMQAEGLEMLHKPIKPAQLRNLMQHLLRTQAK